MDKRYLVLVNGVLWDRKLTMKFAQKVAAELREKGLNATVAYKINTYEEGR